MWLKYYPGGRMHATGIPGTPDHVSDLIGINYLNSICNEISVDMTRLMAPCQTEHRMNAIGLISSKNIVILAFFSTNYLA